MRLQREIADSAKLNNVCSCSIGCRAAIDVTISSLKRWNEGKWRKHDSKRSSTWTCPSHFVELDPHESFFDKCTQ